MAVFIYQGFSATFPFGEDLPSSIAPVTLRVTAPSAGSTFSYTVTNQEPGDLPEVEISGDFTAATIHTTSSIDILNADAYIGQVSWSGGTAQVLAFELGSIDYYFQIGGTPVPSFANLDQALAWYETITGSGPIAASHALGPNKAIRFDSLSSLIDTITEPGPGAAEYTAFDEDDLDGSAAQAIGQFLGDAAGVTVSDVTYAGAPGAAFLVDSFTIGGAAGYDFTGGFLLSSGGFPGPSNTSTSHTVSHGTPGDDDLTETALGAFAGAGNTRDASVIEFTVNVTDTEIDGIRFSLIFGSDEFPEYASTNFTDVAAVYVNGVNVALFNNDATTPLSVTNQSIAGGNFNDNNLVGGGSPYGIEWDGFSNFMTVRGALQQGLNTIKIGVAATGAQNNFFGI